MEPLPLRERKYAVKRSPWMAALIGAFLSILLLALPLSSASGQQAGTPSPTSSHTRWPTVTRRLTDTRWPTATRWPTRTRRLTDTRWPSMTPRPTDTRWPTVTRPPVATRWPSPTLRPSSTRWPTVTRGPTATRRPTSTPTLSPEHTLTSTLTLIPTLTPVPTLTLAFPEGWLRYYNSTYDFEFYYPSDSSLTVQDEGHLQMYFSIMPGTNLATKYLELYIGQASQGCPGHFAGTPAGEAAFNGFPFQIETGTEAGAGELRTFTTYSTQQADICFSLTFILHSGDIAAYPAGTLVFDRAAESALFPRIMNTFRLLAPTPTPTNSPTPSRTTTATPTPSRTATASTAFTPTFDFPKVTVSVGMAACRFGPATAYLWARDLLLGDRGVVWGRAANSTWLYVRMDKLDIACWVAPSVVTVEGDIMRVIVQPVRLPITNALYGPPQNVRAVRSGDQVTVSWDAVWMTADDDRGYFLDVFVCQGGRYVWVPVGLANQYQTSYTFTDVQTCSQPSLGKIYTVEKHGYTSPVDIPWP